jgi:hypothetical protein
VDRPEAPLRAGSPPAPPVDPPASVEGHYRGPLDRPNGQNARRYGREPRRFRRIVHPSGQVSRRCRREPRRADGSPARPGGSTAPAGGEPARSGGSSAGAAGSLPVLADQPPAQAESPPTQADGPPVQVDDLPVRAERPEDHPLRGWTPAGKRNQRRGTPMRPFLHSALRMPPRNDFGSGAVLRPRCTRDRPAYFGTLPARGVIPANPPLGQPQAVFNELERADHLSFGSGSTVLPTSSNLHHPR